MRSNKKLKTAFTFISFAGFLLTFAELIMHIFHTSICSTEGCRLTAQHVRYGDTSILLAGLAVFGTLAMISGINAKLKESRLDAVIDSLLITALACEGFLTGYQAFRLHKPCAFCLTIGSIFAVLGILRILTGKRHILTGFACCAGVFSLLYLITPVETQVCLPQNRQLILFYEKGCPHCMDILNECKQCRIQVYPLSAEKYRTLLEGLGIDEVPVLVINDRGEKKILVGEAKIMRYLQKLAIKKDIFNFSNFLFPTNADACRIGEKCQ